MTNRHSIKISLPSPKKDTQYDVEEIYKEYYRPLLRSFEILLRDEWHWAEDLTHEVFLRILEFQNNTPTPIDTKSVAALLVYLAKFVFVTHKRGYGDVDQRKYDGDPFILFDNVIESDSPDFFDPERILSQDKRIHKMLGRINKLKQVDRDILTLLFYNNYTMKEAADELGLSYANIRKRLQRVRMSLGSFEEVNSEVAV